MYLWAVATQRPADSQTAPSAAATGPVRVKAWSKNPAVLHSVTGDPQRSSPLAVLAPARPPAALQRCCPSPAGSSGHTEPGTRCAPTIARCNCEMHARCPWANLARNSDGSLTRRLSNVGTSASDSLPSLRLSFFCFLCLLFFLLGLDFFQPDRPVAVASSRIASLPAERGQAAQAQTGPLPSSPPSLRLSVIPAEPLLLACLVAARPQLQLAILGPDPHSAVSPPACSAPGLRIIQPPIQWWARPSVWVTGSYFKISSRALSLSPISQFSLGNRPPPLLSSHSHYPSSALLRRRGVTSCLSNLGRSITHPRYPREDRSCPAALPRWNSLASMPPAPPLY